MNATVGDPSAGLKLSPEIVSDAPPVDAALTGAADETTGASNVKTPLAWSVPTTLLTVTATNAAFKIESVDGETHVTVVAELQPVVEHMLEAELRPMNATVPDPSAGLKLCPEIVSDAPPVDAALTGAADETTGASKVKLLLAWSVPTTLLTVTATNAASKIESVDGETHVTVVAELQPVVEHRRPMNATVGDPSAGLKLSPEIVSDAPPVDAALTRAADETTGASKVKLLLAWSVPTTLLTVTATNAAS